MNVHVLALLLTAAAAAPAAAQVAADARLPCNQVPAALVAAALHGRVTNTMNSGWLDEGEARCRYYLRSVDADTTSRIYVLYIQPDADYDGLKENATTPPRDVPGVGDAAHVYVDPDTKRLWLTAVVRGRISVTVSGPDLASVRALAVLALDRYR